MSEQSLWTVHYRMADSEDWIETGIEVTSFSLTFAWDNYVKSHDIKDWTSMRQVELKR